MSCDRRCFDKSDKWYLHEECATCPGQDSGPGRIENGVRLRSCAACMQSHDPRKWPHKPITSNKVISR
jgi:hypothetical protein